MDVDSALSGDDCSATTSSSIHRLVNPDENGHHHHNELDLETSSVYSCDAEGYYTSFHIDSGLKTLKVSIDCLILLVHSLLRLSLIVIE